MTTPINEHNMLTLDFWRDTVTYEGKTVPTGTLGCETLNIPDEVIEKLSKLCPRVNLLLETMNQETPNAALLPDAGKAAEEILTLLRDVPPFHRLDMDFYLPGISKAFTPEGLQAYSSAKLSGSLSTWRNTKRAWSGLPLCWTQRAVTAPRTVWQNCSGGASLRSSA